MIHYLWFALLYIAVGMISGALLTYSYLRPKYEEIHRSAMKRVHARSLSILRDEQYKHDMNTKCLLEELGEALDVDTVDLPSFGNVVLRQLPTDSQQNQIDA